jgi:hypothetical protein
MLHNITNRHVRNNFNLVYLRHNTLCAPIPSTNLLRTLLVLSVHLYSTLCYSETCECKFPFEIRHLLVPNCFSESQNKYVPLNFWHVPGVSLFHRFHCTTIVMSHETHCCCLNN